MASVVFRDFAAYRLIWLAVAKFVICIMLIFPELGQSLATLHNFCRPRNCVCYGAEKQ